MCRPDKAFTPHPHLSIVPDATLDASYQAYRCTHPANHTHISNENYPSFSANRADTGKSGVRISAAYSLLSLLRVTDQSTQLLTIGIGPQIHTSAMASSPWSIRRSRRFSSYGTVPPADYGDFSAYPAPDGRLNIALAQHLTDELQLAAATSILIRWASSIAARRSASNGSYPARFSPDQQFPRQGVLSLGITFNFTFTDPDNFIVFVFVSSPGTSSSQSSGCLVISGS